MDVLNGMRYLVAAVERGSLSAAATHLAVSQPAVSQVISGLEKHFGQTLIRRSSRGVGLTPAGEIVCRHGRAMLRGLESAQAELDGLQNELSGKIRITTVQVLAQTHVGKALLELQKLHPKLRAELISTDEVIDIDEQNIDFAVRVGSPGHGGGVVKRIGEVQNVFVAAPSYLDEVGYPTAPEELAQLNYVQYREDRKVGDILCDGPEGEIVVHLEPGFLAQQPQLLAHAVEVGLGFAISPLFFIADQMAHGKLVEVLPGVRPRKVPLFLVANQNMQNNPRGRAIEETLLEHLAEAPGITLNRNAEKRLEAV